VSAQSNQPFALVVMAQVRDGHDERLLAALEAMGNRPESPFALIESTHFARCLMVPALLDGDDEPLEPAQAYMLFSADFDGSLEEWSGAVANRIGPDLDRVFEHCENYPGSRDQRAFLGFLLEHRVEAGFSVISYPATVAAIRKSLALRRSLRELAVLSQELGPSELRRAWRERFS
jgi:hypothetical protein